MRTSRFALVVLAVVALLMTSFTTGSAAFADPEPTALELRVVVDDCHYASLRP
ncbi:hypothetical protein ACGFJC_01330 [Nonomuraea fuscirosea]|uniref:hypothetical protein n=1 Tax=Nonomuraea fuscirosea TaxID=1291556 RepID=UPI0034305CE6